MTHPIIPSDGAGTTAAPEDILIRQAISVLQDHLKNHPTREGNSVGYRIEQAKNLLEEAHSACLGKENP